MDASFPIIEENIEVSMSTGGVFKPSLSDGLSKKNPNNPDGSPIQITSIRIVCGSVYHWARVRPNSYKTVKSNQNKSKDDNITLCSGTMKGFVRET